MKNKLTKLDSDLEISRNDDNNKLVDQVTRLEQKLWENEQYSSKECMGLFEKWLTLDPKIFYAIPFQKLAFLISLYPEFLEKKQRNKEKLIFGQFLLFLFHIPC